MAVTFSPIFNGWQGFTPSGLPLSGGFVQTYIAGTSTPAATYTTVVGDIAHQNPIQLGSDGRPPSEIWLTSTIAYKFVLFDSLLNPIDTYDNIIGIVNAPSSLWVSVGVVPTFINATQFSVPGNLVSTFQTGLRIQYTIALSQFYGTVTNATFGAGITTVTVLVDSAPLTSGLNAVNVSQLTPNNSVVPTVIQQATTFQKLITSPLGINLGDANLTKYIEGAPFTPTLSFGGASVGITYGINTKGNYTRIGNRVLYEFRLQLTSKGVSVGAAAIGGLPIAPASTVSNEYLGAVIDCNGFTGLTGVMTGIVTGVSGTILINQFGPTGTAAVTDAAFTNASNIWIGGSYPV